MKILITTDWYTPAVNGVVTSVKNLQRELERRGHEVRILTLSQSLHSWSRDGVTAIGSVNAGRIYPGARLRTAMAGRWVRELMDWRPDVIHSQCEFSTFFLARRIAEELDVPLVHTYHTVYEDYTHYFSPSVRWGRCAVAAFSRWVAAQVDGMIAPTGKVRGLLQGYGVSCHSSNPDKGVNAVYHMMAVIEEIRRIIPNEHPILGKGILELTDIISSPYPGASVVPALCRATFDRRTLTGENEAVILGQVEEAIARAREKIPGLKARTYLAEGKEVCWTGEAIAAKRYFPAWLIDEDNEYVQKALAGLKKAGIEAPISHFSFCTNGSHFCGEAGIPCIGYGPSLESLAHVRDEYIEIEQLTKACRGFASILRELTQ